jgi:hypothetical protein
MIKFFRKIRQKMLTENKFSKYLIYAIGEIVLVVIGILIALSINNWNEQEKLNSKELAILTELQSALNSNKEILNNRSKHFKTIKYEGKLLEEHLKNKLAYNDSLQNYLDIPIRNYYFGISYSTYENLKSQGFDIIKNKKLRLKIIELYDEQFGLLKDQEIKISNGLTNNIQPILFKYFKTTPEGGLEPNNYEKLLSSSDYLNVLSLMIFLANVYDEYCDNSIMEINKLLEAIETEIEQRKK